jgi:hypothetical protein
MLSLEEIRSTAVRVQWDDDIFKHVYESRCSCGGEYYMKNLVRNPHIPRTLEERLKWLQDSTRLLDPTYDVVECRCAKCKKTAFLAFAPERIHTDLREVLRSNQEWIRLDPAVEGRSEEVHTGWRHISRCRYWYCSQCNSIFLKGGAQKCWLQKEETPTIIIGSVECPDCGRSYAIEDIAIGLHDAPRDLWSKLEPPVEI